MAVYLSNVQNKMYITLIFIYFFQVNQVRDKSEKERGNIVEILRQKISRLPE